MRLGSLFSGCGGLDMAVNAVFGSSTAWHVEFEKAPSKVLAANWPDVPNHRDVTTVDWSAVEPVDILAGGYPCQPFSLAGRRAGTDDERHLWPYVAEAIAALQPSIVIFENVRGHLSLGFDEVMRDLNRLGYRVEWGLFKASDVGAPHGRSRLFMIGVNDARCVLCGDSRRGGNDRDRRSWQLLQVESSRGNERQGEASIGAFLSALRRDCIESEGAVGDSSPDVRMGAERQERAASARSALAISQSEARSCTNRIPTAGSDGERAQEAKRQNRLDASGMRESSHPQSSDVRREPARTGTGAAPDAGRAGGSQVPVRNLVGAERRLVWACGVHREISGQWLYEGGACIRAADVGAPHGRYRVFVVAYAERGAWRPSGPAAAGEAQGGRASAVSGGRDRTPVELPAGAFMFSTPDTMPDAPNKNSNRVKQPGGLNDQVMSLFRTPAAAEAEGGPRNPDREGATMRLSDQVREEQGRGLLLPTPVAQPSGNSPEGHLRKKPGREVGTDLSIMAEHNLFHSGGRIVQHQPAGVTWGPYEPAVRRWEAATRPAPSPTKGDGRDGRHRLSSEFVEWMQGYASGHVTGHGLTRSEELRILGNTVVPQQGAEAVRQLWARATATLNKEMAA